MPPCCGPSLTVLAICRSTKKEVGAEEEALQEVAEEEAVEVVVGAVAEDQL